MTDVTIDDTLRDTYASIMGRGQEGDFAAGSDENQQGTGEQDDVAANAGANEQDGAQAGSQEGAGAGASGEGEEGAGEAAGEQEGQQEQNTFRPPWKKAALADWDKLPASARAEIERRENDFHKGIEQYKTGAAQAQEFERAVAPYMATIQSLGATPMQAVSELMKTDHLLRYSQPQQKVGMLLQIANSYGVDLQTLANGIQQLAGEQVWQQQNPADPRLQALQTQVANLTNQLNTTRQQAQNVEHSAIDSEIAAFAADPDHEHFGILQQDMAVLLQAGRAKDLEEAYEMAMRQNPQTYQIWLAQQQQEWDAQRKAQVAKAKAAGANNVRPNGRASMARAAPANETMEQTLERVAREQGLIN